MAIKGYETREITHTENRAVHNKQGGYTGLQSQHRVELVEQAVRDIQADETAKFIREQKNR